MPAGNVFLRKFWDAEIFWVFGITAEILFLEIIFFHPEFSSSQHKPSNGGQEGPRFSQNFRDLQRNVTALGWEDHNWSMWFLFLNGLVLDFVANLKTLGIYPFSRA